jgi:putative ABC transport system substrate-binding protein
VKRRTFLGCAATTGAASPLAWGGTSLAQEARRIARIAVITGLSEQDVQSRARIAAFKAGMAAAGWREGETLAIDVRYAPDSQDRARALVAELLALRPDVALLQAPAVPAMLEVDSPVPVVFLLGGDPVASGWVQNLAHPGGKLTGFTSADPSIGSKWVEYLKEAAPEVRHITVVGHNSVTNYRPHIDASARRLGIDVTYAPVESVADLAPALAAAASRPFGGLVLPTDALTTQFRTAIAATAIERRLPLSSGSDPFAEAGGLVVYAVDTVDVYRRSAAYVDRILRGTPPGSLPVQRPTIFKLSVNQRTARALGLALPPTLIARADEVIE